MMWITHYTEIVLPRKSSQVNFLRFGTLIICDNREAEIEYYKSIMCNIAVARHRTS